MSFLQNSTTFAPYLNMKPHRTYILYISICLWLLASPLCIGNLWGKDFVVVIDAGHGGHDPGAIGKISKEKNIKLNVALKLGNLIKKNCDDVKVIYTRSRDVFIPLDRRAEIANNAKADLFISVHTNALAKNRTAKGASTWTLGLAKSDANLEVAKRENSVILYESDYQTRYAGFNPNSAESYIIFEFMQDKYMEQSVHLASLVQKQFRHTCKRVDRGVHQAGFLVLKASAMPSILVELGFISTPEEERYLNSEAGANTMAKGIYHAFLNYKREQEIRLTGASKTIIPTEEPATNPTESSKNALETMLSTDLSLNYPLNSNNVVREYSEKSVYFKTLNVWKPHTGVDFGGNLGDDVTAMTGGVVTNVCEDKMLGKIVEISTDNVICRYCGLGSVDVNKGDSIDVGKKVGTIGAVPFEAGDENHIHIEVKIDGKYADPLSFINNNE